MSSLPPVMIVFADDLYSNVNKQHTLKNVFFSPKKFLLVIYLQYEKLFRLERMVSIHHRVGHSRIELAQKSDQPVN